MKRTVFPDDNILGEFLFNDFGFITASRAEYTPNENRQRNRSILAHLACRGYRIYTVKGVYTQDFNTPRALEIGDSFFICVDDSNGKRLEKTLAELGEQFGQDSILFYPRKKSQAFLIGTNSSVYPGYRNRVDVPIEAAIHKESPLFLRPAGSPFRFTKGFWNLSVTQCGNNMGRWAATLEAEKDWRTLEVVSSSREEKISIGMILEITVNCVRIRATLTDFGRTHAAATITEPYSCKGMHVQYQEDIWRIEPMVDYCNGSDKNRDTLVIEKLKKVMENFYRADRFFEANAVNLTRLFWMVVLASLLNYRDTPMLTRGKYLENRQQLRNQLLSGQLSSAEYELAYARLKKQGEEFNDCMFGIYDAFIKTVNTRYRTGILFEGFDLENLLGRYIFSLTPLPGIYAATWEAGDAIIGMRSLVKQTRPYSDRQY